jgi:hypothetical protein
MQLDENLNKTRKPLRDRCNLANGDGWFTSSPYEVMLELLFKAKLPEID